MCGIVYVQRKDGKPARKQVLKRYEKQKARGNEGFGFVALSDTHDVEAYKRHQTETGVRKTLEKTDSSHILFHHRYPTSTINVPESAHPIFISHKELKHSYYVVHNGVISNPGLLKKEHEKLGYVYSTEIETQYATKKGVIFSGGSEFNDSEALAIDFARTVEGLQPSVEATGSIALIAIQTNKAGTVSKALYYGTNGGNPLNIDKGPHGTCIASQGGTPVVSGVMFRQDFKTDTTERVHCPLPAYRTAYDYEPYKYTATEYSGKFDSSKPYGFEFEPEEGDYTPDGLPVDDPYSGERSIDELQEALGDVMGDLSIAKDVGDPFEIESLEIEKLSIIEEINEYVARQRTIGF